MAAEAASSAPRASAHPLRVLMVLESDFTQKGGGGAESQLRTIARHLMSLGHRVTIVTPLLPYGPQITSERCYRIPIGRIPYPRVRLVGGAIMCLRLGAFLWNNRERYDAWHVHIAHHMGAVTCLVGALAGKPVVLKVSGWWELEQGVLAPRRRPIDALAGRWLKRASAVQAISTRIADELRRHGFPGDRVIVLPNAVDTARFKRRSGSRQRGTPFTAVFVGRLVPEKGLATLLDGWAEAFRGRGDVRLRLVGGGPLEPQLREQAERLGIAEQLEWLGHRDRVEDVLEQADVGVLSSTVEGLSNTLLEFMASGLPTISSRVSGSEDFIVPSRSGWLFPPSEPRTLAECLRQASALDPEALSEMGRQAREDVEAAAALDTVVGRLIALYRGAHPRELATGSGGSPSAAGAAPPTPLEPQLGAAG